LHRKYSENEFKNLLNSYNEKLIDISSNIIFKRLNFLIEFESFFESSFSMLIVLEHKASISYFSDALGEINPGNKKLELEYIKKKVDEIVYSKAYEEMKRGVTLAGPQRDDYIFKLRKNETKDNVPFELRNFASQGEHKTFLIALKLSEYDYLKEKKNTSPVLLLDDVLSELDEDRVSKIISHLKDYGQIFLTTTDKAYLENLKEFYSLNDISVFEIEQGKSAN
jgi:DNA replication and repair protein RecF